MHYYECLLFHITFVIGKVFIKLFVTDYSTKNIELEFGWPTYESSWEDRLNIFNFYLVKQLWYIK